MADSAYHKMRTELAAAPIGCPVNHEFSPFAEHYMQDPRTRLENPMLNVVWLNFTLLNLAWLSFAWLNSAGLN